MIYSTLLSLFNLTIAVYLSKKDEFFKTKNDQATGEFTTYFSNAPTTFSQQISLRENNKYKTEYSLFIFVLCGFLVINIALSYFVVRFLSNHENELIENLFKSLFVEFIVIIATGLILNKFNETVLNFKKIKSGNFYQAYVGEEKIYFPFMTLEGAVSTELSKTQFPYFTIPFNEIQEFIIEPCRRVASVRGFTYTPPYYKILLKDKNVTIYIMRMYFFNLEKMLMEKIADKINCSITYNDELR